MGFIYFLLIFGFFVLIAGVRVIDQYERGVVLTLGKYTSTRQPGLTWILIVVQRMMKVDMRIDTVDIPQQEVITKDNVTVGINAVVYFKVMNSEKAMLEIQDFKRSVAMYAQATLRDVIGEVELDTLLSQRDKIALNIKQVVDVATDPWGIDVQYIKMQDIELPADMKRVMAKQAEAERMRRAIIIQAEGEFTAADKLSQAAELLTGKPGGIAMRTLQTIEKINPDPSKTVIFALPIEFMEGLKTIGQMFKEKK
ncbi:MAG: SPFH domain-containing protein [Planctomycetes bacterium]|jgi:regulator of protease activity HflC (stomatin/prohibitin superfamily)|nr:SPFH domain-containing protein [Planctomycetota bacterium]